MPQTARVARHEFDRQVETLLAKGYPAQAGLTQGELRSLLARLRPLVEERAETFADPSPGRVPFVVVTTVVGPETAIALTDLAGRPGTLNRHASDIGRFTPIQAVRLPDPRAYLLVDVDRGAEFVDVRPNDSLVTITERGRTPLTVEEGIALVTAFPAALEKNRCFSLAGSRCGDARVPALWISAGAPTLGWCWAGNPHSWLGTAHAGARLA